MTIRRSNRPSFRSTARAAAVAFTLTAAAFSSHRAAAQNTVSCDNMSSIGNDTRINITQHKASVQIEVSRPNSAGRKLEIEYGDELYSKKFGADGKLRTSFALTAVENSFVITMSETQPLSCKATVTDFNKVYRAILRWRDPVQLDLVVLEPGSQLGSSGHVSMARPNAQLTQGIGQIDVASTAPAEGATGEISYVVSELSAIPAGGNFRYRLDYVTRGNQPEMPYCDEGALATPAFELILLDRGTVSTRKLGLNRLRCKETIPEGSQLLPLRQ